MTPRHWNPPAGTFLPYTRDDGYCVDADQVSEEIAEFLFEQFDVAAEIEATENQVSEAYRVVFAYLDDQIDDGDGQRYIYSSPRVYRQESAS